MEKLFKKYGLSEQDVEILETRIKYLKQPKEKSSLSKNHSPIQVWDKFISTIYSSKKKEVFIKEMRKADSIFQ